MHRHTSKKEAQKNHERSLDDFLKHLKKYNLKSQRYDRILSPDRFAPYRQNTTHTLERSRTLSGKHSKKTTKTTRQKIEKILNVSKQKQRGSVSNIISKSQSAITLPNPADLISEYSKKIREAQTILNGRSKMGVLLCKKFLEMLNQLVQNMVLNLQQNLEQLQKSIYERLERQIGEEAEVRAASLQRKVSKLERQTLKLIEKQNYNSNLIYHLRLQNIDIDRAFGQCVFGSDQFGGRGYNKPSKQPSEQSLNQLSASEMIFVKRRKQEEEARDPFENEFQEVSLGRGEWQLSAGRGDWPGSNPH